MTRRHRRVWARAVARFLRGILLLSAAAAVLAGCGVTQPTLDLSSPVGTWRAAAPDTGVLEIDPDGTLTVEDS